MCKGQKYSQTVIVFFKQSQTVYTESPTLTILAIYKTSVEYACEGSKVQSKIQNKLKDKTKTKEQRLGIKEFL